MQRHPDWAEGMSAFLRRRLAQPAVSADEADLLRDVIVASRADTAVQAIVSDALAEAATSTALRLLLLEVIERSEFTAATLPASWRDRLTEHLLHADEAVARRSIVAATRIGGDRFDAPLGKLAGDAGRNEGLRVARQLLLEVNAMGLPVGCEFLDMIDRKSVV